jgi:hypothetical protein
MLGRIAMLLVLVVGCARREAPALQPVSESAVLERVERFVTAGRTTRAYVELAVGLADVGVGDPAIAAQAELRIVSLAAPLAASVRHRPMTEQLDRLALTVWPALLREPVRDGESVDDYLGRLCTGPLRSECGAMGPAQRAVVVRAIAMRRADERMRAALATCLDCRGSEWDRIGFMWESLSREATHYLASLRRDELRSDVIATTLEPAPPTL